MLGSPFTHSYEKEQGLMANLALTVLALRRVPGKLRLTYVGIAASALRTVESAFDNRCRAVGAYRVRHFVSSFQFS